MVGEPSLAAALCALGLAAGADMHGEAVSRTRSTDIAALRGYMESPGFSLDLYKGAPGSFRAWSGQLRQPVLLAAHNAVIERAPLEGVLHRSNTLDTLGLDAPEAACPRRRAR